MPHDQLPPFVLKDSETFAMLDGRGEICPLTHPDSGIFHRGTRHVSRLELLLGEHRPAVLSATARGETGIHVSHQSDAAGTVHLERTTVLTPAAFLQQLSFISYRHEPLQMPIRLLIEADFCDIFEVRGNQRRARGSTVRSCTCDGLAAVYRGLDAVDRQTLTRLSGPLKDVKEGQLSMELTLDPRRTQRIWLVLDFASNPDPGTPEQLFQIALESTTARFRAARRMAAEVHSDNPAFNTWLWRSFSDLHLLSSQLDHGLYPYAGVPWFSCPFGRDGLITARQMLLFEPRMARGVLGLLADLQARRHDPSSDAEVGKILHETRLGEMAALGEVPFARYYGSVDSTPLFLILAGDYLLRSGDRPFLAEIRPALEAAMAWIRRAEGRAGDGFLRYRRAAQGGLRNQGWKDSDDAVHDADGNLAEGSIALCEVQAYCYAARRALAHVQRAFGDADAAEQLLEEARVLRRRFHDAFWCLRLGTYALALDGEGRSCEVRSSNAGHCLWSGIASRESAASVARQLLEPTSFNGWGVRTLDEREQRYNPMSYHNGSIWPHDNCLIALGLARYGHTAAAMRIHTGLFDAARAIPLSRLPELFCGLPRRSEEGPTLYPVACSPQAWASGVPFGLLEAITGMGISHDSQTGRMRVMFRNPELPERINRLEIRGLRLGEEEIDLELHRGEADTGVLVKRRSSGVDVVVYK
ncbi:MAG: glycogen debranching N-terminal domain-containing protein [Cyanobacteriota bacterium]|nr:glycogen debranching N-terminal domain-containing protein [Cyanobacteriota bacterium]